MFSFSIRFLYNYNILTHRKNKTPTKGQLHIIVLVFSVNQSCSLFVASGSSGSRALMLACSGTTQSPNSLWAAAQLVHTVPVIYLDPDSLKIVNTMGTGGPCPPSTWQKIKLITESNDCWKSDIFKNGKGLITYEIKQLLVLWDCRQHVDLIRTLRSFRETDILWNIFIHLILCDREEDTLIPTQRSEKPYFIKTH